MLPVMLLVVTCENKQVDANRVSVSRHNNLLSILNLLLFSMQRKRLISY